MKEEFLGLKELKVEFLKSKKNNKPIVRIVQIETNKDREERGKKPIVSKFKLIDKDFGFEESFMSSEIEGTIVYGPASENFPYNIVVFDTEFDNDVMEVKLKLETKK